MFYKTNRVIHMRQGIGRERIAMCGIELHKAKRAQKAKKATCKNCRRVMESALKYNKFYKPYL